VHPSSKAGAQQLPAVETSKHGKRFGFFQQKRENDGKRSQKLCFSPRNEMFNDVYGQKIGNSPWV